MSKIRFYGNPMAASLAANLSSGGIRAAALLAISIGVLGISSKKVGAQPQVTGQWVTLPYQTPINPIHVGLLHSGKVLIVAGSENNATNHKSKPRTHSIFSRWS